MLDAMQQHIEQLCHENDIWWKPWLKRSDKAYAISIEDSERWNIREILTAPIRSTISYATALHEIGHYLGRYQRRRYRTVTREAWAWEWARQNALVWTPGMERCATNAVARYRAREHANRRAVSGCV
jgi:hypothetical protein